MQAMRRIKNVKIDNLSFDLAEMTMRESKIHVAGSRDFADRGEKAEALRKTNPTAKEQIQELAVSNEEWETRTIETVSKSLNDAMKQVNPNVDASELWNGENIFDRIGRGTLNALYPEVLRVSGLLPVGEGGPGEAKAE